MEINPHTPRGKTMSGKPALTADEQKINNLWEEHLRTEFDAHRAAALLHRAEREDRMNILMVSTPATGHINPLLGVARVLIAEGHNVVCASRSL